MFDSQDRLDLDDWGIRKRDGKGFQDILKGLTVELNLVYCTIVLQPKSIASREEMQAEIFRVCGLCK